MSLEHEMGRTRLSEFLRTRQRELLAMWTERVRKLSPAKEISSLAITDHLPDVLDRLAAAVGAGEPSVLADAPRAHAVDRLARGFDLREVVQEYRILRHCILELWEQQI